MAVVSAPDMELWLCGWLRAQLKQRGHDVQVSNKEPASLKQPLKRPLVVIRDDGGPRVSHVTFNRSFGVSVLAGTRQNDKPVNDLARLVAALLQCDEIYLTDDSPVASVEFSGCNGPYPVVEPGDVGRRYLTVEYTVAGQVL